MIQDLTHEGAHPQPIPVSTGTRGTFSFLTPRLLLAGVLGLADEPHAYTAKTWSLIP